MTGWSPQSHGDGAGTGIVILFGGDGGCILQSINFQTARITRITTSMAMTFLVTRHLALVTLITCRFARPIQNRARSGRLYCESKELAGLCCNECRCRDDAPPLPRLPPPRSRSR